MMTNDGDDGGADDGGADDKLAMVMMMMTVVVMMLMIISISHLPVMTARCIWMISSHSFCLDSYLLTSRSLYRKTFSLNND